MKKTCENCRFKEYLSSEQPCLTCYPSYGESHWEAAD